MKSLIFLIVLSSFGAFGQASKYHENWAFINANGELVFEISAKHVRPFHNQRAAVRMYTIVGNKAYFNYGFIDENGQLVIPTDYEEVRDFKKGIDVTWAKKRGEKKYILINKKGERVGNVEYDKVGYWFEGMCQVAIEDKTQVLYNGSFGYWYGFVNDKGEEIIAPKAGYSGSGFYSDGLVCLTKGNAAGYGFFDKEGQEVIPMRYAQAGSSSFYNGLARVKKQGKTGLINQKGEFVVEPKYSTVTGFGDSLLTVAFGPGFNNFGYVNFSNQVVIKGQFERASSFKNGLAEVKLDGLEGIIKTDGSYLIPAKYNTVYNESDKGYLMAVFEGKWTYFDLDGQVIHQAKAKSNNGLPVAIYNKANKEWFYYSANGEKAFPYRFCKAEQYSDNGLALVKLCKDIRYLKTKK